MATGVRRRLPGYCWPVDTIDDLRLPTFQVLAGEGNVRQSAIHLGAMRLRRYLRGDATHPPLLRLNWTKRLHLGADTGDIPSGMISVWGRRQSPRRIVSGPAVRRPSGRSGGLPAWPVWPVAAWRWG
jgi:hypothetical protein